MIKFIFFCFILLIGCSSNNQISKNIKDESIGIKHETDNFKFPYIYENGYKNYSFLNEFIIELDNEKRLLNELKFEAVFSSGYTQKAMYDKYGKWSKEIFEENRLILIWENIKLFSDNEDLFLIIADGKETNKDMFASIMVLNSTKHYEDCLTENSTLRPLVINYFSNAIQNLNKSKTFYNLYHQTKNKYLNKN